MYKKKKNLFKICYRVPTADEVEKWRLSFSHVMNSESKSNLNQNKANKCQSEYLTHTA